MAAPLAGRRCLTILAGMAGFARSGNPARQSRGYRPARTLGTRLSVDSSAWAPGTVALVNRLGDLERAIMDVLWESRDPLTVRQVSGRLTERDLAHTTVMTVLDRLAKKGFARRERDGRAWRYLAAATREAYVTELMLNALDQTGDRYAALARFARSVSDTEAAALRRALEALGHPDAREDGHSKVSEDGHGQGRVREATGE
jgi:predicted transcriptional regulator